jgi:hypothetical protein
MYESLLTIMARRLAGFLSADPNACVRIGGAPNRDGALSTLERTHEITSGLGGSPAKLMEL